MNNRKSGICRFFYPLIPNPALIASKPIHGRQITQYFIQDARYRAYAILEYARPKASYVLYPLLKTTTPKRLFD